MESASSLNWVYNSLLSELNQGMENAKQLRFHLYASGAPDLQLPDLLIQKVLDSYGNALRILKRPSGDAKPTSSLSRKSSISVDGNPKSQEEANKNLSDHQVDRSSPKKRKMQHTWTEQVRIKSENGLEGPTDDGYSWRKYGQKDILGTKYPRSYYRCTYRLLQNCSAIKQVQRSDDDPTIFFITYKGTHTCNQSNNAVPKHGKQKQKHDSQNHQPQEQNQTLWNFKANLKVNTDDLDKDVGPNFLFPSTFEIHERDNYYYYPTSGLVADDSHQSTISSLFYSPGTSESNYFAAENYHIIHEEAPNLQQHPESDIAEIKSGHASTTSSPIGGMGFPFDSVELDPNFPFSDLEFYA